MGYVGESKSLEVLLGGLRRLEYRGYDSAGVAVHDEDGTLGVRKRAGKLDRLLEDLEASPLPNGSTGIGHTRWATHGGPTDRTAHPHLGDDGKLALIHNGIIENSRSSRTTSSRTATRSRATPTPRSPPASSAANTASRTTSSRRSATR